MKREPRTGVLQPLIPKMSTSHPRAHAPTAHHTYAGCEKISPDSSLRSANGSQDETWSIHHARDITLKAAVALIIVLSPVWWLLGHQVSPLHNHGAVVTHPVTFSPQRYVRAPTSPLLEVFQMHPPVLTAGGDGALEITDDSSKFSGRKNDSNHAVCKKILAVHSFGYSYGQPFVGNYTPPTCKFNRVTWNLTVVSAGRQFDRLGAVYLGDIEVFRTSTAEPTANGIVWTYLKVSRSRQLKKIASN